jgi:hypothetical protein
MSGSEEGMGAGATSSHRSWCLTSTRGSPPPGAAVPDELDVGHFERSRGCGADEQPISAAMNSATLALPTEGGRIFPAFLVLVKSTTRGE